MLLLNVDVNSLSYEEVCEYYGILNDKLKELSDKVELVKTRIKMETVSGPGPEWLVEGDNHKLKVVKRTSHLPDEDKFKALLKEKNIPSSKAFVDVVTTSAVIDPSKIDALINLGFITQAEVDQCKKTTIALYCERK